MADKPSHKLINESVALSRQVLESQANNLDAIVILNTALVILLLSTGAAYNRDLREIKSKYRAVTKSGEKVIDRLWPAFAKPDRTHPYPSEVLK